MGCTGKADCDADLDDNSFTIDGTDYHFIGIASDGSRAALTLNADASHALLTLKALRRHQRVPLSGAFGSRRSIRLTGGSGLAWTAGTGVSLSIGTSCAQATSNNANLGGLSVTGSTDNTNFSALSGANALAPAFDADTTAYRATVGNDVTHVRLTPTVADTGKATVTVAGNTVADGAASAAISLSVGDNDITVRVTAEDASTKDYTVTVRRAPSDTVWYATLTVGDIAGDRGCATAGTASDRCAARLTDDDISYASADYEITELYFTTGSLVAIVNKTIPDSLKSALTLNVGSSQFPLANATFSTSTNTNDALTWTNTGLSWSVGDTISLSLTPTATSSNANLSNLTAEGSTDGSTFTALTGGATLSPAFDKTVTSYTATVGNAVTHAKVTPTVEDTGKATVAWRKGATGNFTTVTSGSPTSAISLDVGDNAITVRVTAEAGNTKDYTVTITRQAQTTLSPNANLGGLTASSSDSSGGTFSPVTLSPAFDAATTGYTATVANNQTHAKLTPTVADTGKATVTVAGNTVNDGTASGAISLDVGDNAITVRVTAEDSTTKDYTVTITRSASTTTPTVSLSASPNPVDEGESVTITSSLSQALDSSVTIPLRHERGTAEPGDYGAPRSITIAAGDTTGKGVVTTAQDADHHHESFTVRLGVLPPEVAAGDPSSVVVTILDDEAPLPEGTTVWEATLTVANTLTSNTLKFYGCANTSVGKECSTATVLTDDDFTYNGVEYRFTGIQLHGGGNLF